MLDTIAIQLYVESEDFRNQVDRVGIYSDDLVVKEKAFFEKWKVDASRGDTYSLNKLYELVQAGEFSAEEYGSIKKLWSGDRSDLVVSEEFGEM